MLNTLHIFQQCLGHNDLLRCVYFYFNHFTDEETETKRVKQKELLSLRLGQSPESHLRLCVLTTLFYRLSLEVRFV